MNMTIPDGDQTVSERWLRAFEHELVAQGMRIERREPHDNTMMGGLTWLYVFTDGGERHWAYPIHEFYTMFSENFDAGMIRDIVKHAICSGRQYNWPASTPPTTEEER